MTTSRLAVLVAVIVVAAVAGAAALRPDPARGDAAPVSEKGIVVTGTGSVTTVPDRGSFTFGVTSRAATAAAAVRANNTAMNAVVAALKKAGVDVEYVRPEKGPHGFGLKDFWSGACIDWLRKHRF